MGCYLSIFGLWQTQFRTKKLQDILMSEYFKKSILNPIVEYAHYWYLSRQSLDIVSQPDEKKIDRIQQLTSIVDTSSEKLSYILAKTKQIPVNLNFVLDSSKSMLMNIPFKKSVDKLKREDCANEPFNYEIEILSDQELWDYFYKESA